MNYTKRIATTAERLKEAMLIVGKSQNDLANETGLSHSTISRYISGAIEPRQKAAHLLAQALNVSETWLWGYDVQRERTPSQVKAGIMSDIYHKIMQDEELFDMVEKLAQLDAEKRQVAKTVLNALTTTEK